MNYKKKAPNEMLEKLHLHKCTVNLQYRCQHLKNFSTNSKKDYNTTRNFERFHPPCRQELK